MNNGASKDQAVDSLKKNRVFQNGSLSKQKPKDFFPSQSQITINFDPLKFLQGPYFSGRRALGPPKVKSW